MLGETTVAGVELTDVADRQPPRRCRSPACSWPSATTRAASCSPASSSWTTTGYIQVEHPSTRTNIDGVFACGDVVDHIYRQAITVGRHRCGRGDRRRALARRDLRRALNGHRHDRPAGSPAGTRSQYDREEERPMAGNTVTVTDASFAR